MTIREQVLGYLSDHPHRNISVTTMSEALGLTRRQVMTALHGLKRNLGDQLGQSGAGHWLYTPPMVASVNVKDGYHVGDVPVVWKSRIQVVALMVNEYLAAVIGEDGSDSGVRLRIVPLIDGVEILEGPAGLQPTKHPAAKSPST